ncbi:hypothetical protein [Lentzea flava]|uniref:Uncharacterized protein n=1 Tax=Lentzea flava TaxID=103732 RepID=A0ABQ2VA09_9PSEU|nr:hypothetical protein [Lentzea flava]GGU73363.1 hypothetical protein GCM10010178_76090 [Lentzea flava]
MVAAQDKPPQALGTMITTAVMTAAIVPFVQELAKRAAQDSYDATRTLLRRLFREARTKSGDGPGQLLIVKDDDPGAKAVLYAKPDMSDEAIRALAELDLDGLTAKNRKKPDKVRIFWDEAAGRWRVDRK